MSSIFGFARGDVFVDILCRKYSGDEHEYNNGGHEYRKSDLQPKERSRFPFRRFGGFAAFAEPALVGHIDVHLDFALRQHPRRVALVFVAHIARLHLWRPHWPNVYICHRTSHRTRWRGRSCRETFRSGFGREISRKQLQRIIRRPAGWCPWTTGWRLTRSQSIDTTNHLHPSFLDPNLLFLCGSNQTRRGKRRVLLDV
jgi:hypothetical protein